MAYREFKVSYTYRILFWDQEIIVAPIPTPSSLIFV